MTKDEIYAAIDHCRMKIVFLSGEAERAREELYEAESQLEDEENTLDELRQTLEEYEAE